MQQQKDNLSEVKELLMKINIKQLIEQSKATQKTQEKKIEEYEVIKEEEFAKLHMKYIEEKVKFEISQ